ncbi:hypothetical protein [Sphaerisporangium perillae]|uniref:hypothetical protein n=1 Tax=Sphaerisporangium perillae TaxID=2935860 RepID=UPI00200EEC72|nr:hypothetical protein [Sphaerisporangium perillae]
MGRRRRPVRFADIQTFGFDITVPYTHQAWRGRIRTCNGVGATLTDTEVAAFDADPRLLCERFREESLMVPHRISALVAR